MSTSSVIQNVKSSDSDVHISRENQKKINLFAIRNGWIEELNEELKFKQNELKNVEDAESDVMMLMDGDTLPILIGEAFILFEQSRAAEMVEEMREKIKSDISTLESRVKHVKQEMAKLKLELYNKFGDSINLECEEE